MAGKKRYEVNLVGLPEGETELDFMADTEFFREQEQPDVVDSDVRVHLKINHKNGVYYCDFYACGIMHIPCDRCLEPMEHHVDTEESLTVKYGVEYDDSTDGLLIIPENMTSPDFAPLICDMLLLSIPMRHVHPSGGCDPAMRELLNAHSTEEEEEEEEES